MSAHVISESMPSQQAITGLELHTDEDGVHLCESDGSDLIFLPWEEIRWLSAGRVVVDPYGAPAQTIELAGTSQTIHLLVSVPDASVLASAISALGYGGSLGSSLRESTGHSSLRHARRARLHGPRRVARAAKKATPDAAYHGVPVPAVELASHRFHRRWWRSRSLHVAALGIALISLLVSAGVFTPRSTRARSNIAENAIEAGNSTVSGMVTGGWKLKLNLPPATVPPEPAPPSLAQSAPLRPHEIFGFAPYWTLPISNGFNVSALTTIAYFGVDVNANGTLSRTGTGWAGFQSQYLATLITRAHMSSVRVVLTAKCFSQSTLDSLTSDPAAAKVLAAQLVSAIESKNMDGVNLDFEGTGSADQAGLTRLVDTVSAALHSVDPHWQLTMDTYASAATDPGGFYDIPALAPAVNAFFVMAYDMNSFSVPSPTAPLDGANSSDLTAIKGYLSRVAPGKVILGVPFYGYDWPTSGDTLGAPAAGPPAALSYAVIAAANLPTYWDPQTSTPWTAYQTGGQWHEIYFDNPVSLGLKARLANFFGLRGLGVWALGMDGNDPAMIAALLGHAPPLKSWVAGPPPTSAPPTTVPPTTTTVPPTTTTVPPTTTTVPTPVYFYEGTWNGQTVTLANASKLQSGPPGSTQPAGQLTGFQTDNPAFKCLDGDTLWVWTSASYPGQYLVDNVMQNQCATGTWLFKAASLVNVTSSRAP